MPRQRTASGDNTSDKQCKHLQLLLSLRHHYRTVGSIAAAANSNYTVPQKTSHLAVGISNESTPGNKKVNIEKLLQVHANK